MITFAPTLLRFALPGVPLITQFENSLGAKVLTRREKILWHAMALLAKGQNLDPRFGSLLTESRAVIALSHRHADVLAIACPSVLSKIKVIPAPSLIRVRPEDGGLAREEGRAKLGLGRDASATFVLIYFGYIYPGKGVETLIKAFWIARNTRLALRSIKMKLVVVGKITDEEFGQRLTSLKQSLQFGADVVWTGYAEAEESSTYCRAADIAILPFDDGVRLNNSSFAFCAAHGLPIITTEGAKVESAFKPMENVFLCAPKDPDKLAFAIEQLVLSRALRLKLQLGALALASSDLSPDHTISETLETFKSVSIKFSRTT
jgi:glycosyltransferase involved in cell wall biosynthesis